MKNDDLPDDLSKPSGDRRSMIANLVVGTALLIATAFVGIVYFAMTGGGM